MPNFMTIDKSSNLILSVISLKGLPAETREHKFIPATDKAISVLDKWMLQNPGLLMDVGDLMSRTQYINDYIIRTRKDKAQAPRSNPQRQYYRAEQPEKLVDRKSAIDSWICANPDANEHDLSIAFGMGTVAAKAYLLAYEA